MEPVDKTIVARDAVRGPHAVTGAERRRALVREVVAGAVLPGLLARKDAGVFDRGPNVVRLMQLRDGR